MSSYKNNILLYNFDILDSLNNVLLIVRLTTLVNKSKLCL